MKAKQINFDIPKGRPAVYRQRQLTDESGFPFGKHKGTSMQNVPIDFYRWLLQQDWCNKWPAVVAYAKTRLENELKFTRSIEKTFPQTNTKKTS